MPYVLGVEMSSASTFFPGGSAIVTIDDRGSATVTDTTSGDTLLVVDGVAQAGFSPDRRWVVVVDIAGTLALYPAP